MSKVNVIRNMKNKTSERSNSKTLCGLYNSELEKEQKWDNRFHLGKLPKYDAYQDENCNYLFNKLFVSSENESPKKPNTRNG
jgi:hypothetical protein